MKTKILFCNIAWMKNYTGITDDDQPINGGAYIERKKIGGEIYNFHDYNGKCYGYVKTYGNMALESHFPVVSKNNEYVDDVLVVWVATSEKNETRIVGWYKNARVYRSFQEQPVFTYPNNSLYYNITADARDCFLLPIEERTFPIERAAHVGTGMGIGRSNIWYAESEFARATIVPKVVQYIEDYSGEYANFVYRDEDIEKQLRDIKEPNDFEILYDKGIIYWEKGDLSTALSYLLKAKEIKEDMELLYNIGLCFLQLYQYDHSIEIFKEIIEIEGNKSDTLLMLVNAYDAIGDRDNMLKYANILVDLLDDSDNDYESKIEAYCLMFDVHFHENQLKEAEMIIDKLAKYSNDTKVKETIQRMNAALKEKSSI